jgi:hypothetical protein
MKLRLDFFYTIINFGQIQLLDLGWGGKNGNKLDYNIIVTIKHNGRRRNVGL